HYLRVRIGRRLKQLGAVAIKNSVYVLPGSAAARDALGDVVKDVQQRGGDAVVCEARFLDGLSDGAVEDLFREAHERDYAAIAGEARRLAAALQRGATGVRRPPALSVER